MTSGLLQRLAGRDGLTRGAPHFDRRDVIQALAELAREGATLEELEAVAEHFLSTDQAIPLTTSDRTRSEVIRRADGRTVVAMPSAERRVLSTSAQRRAD